MKSSSSSFDFCRNWVIEIPLQGISFNSTIIVHIMLLWIDVILLGKFFIYITILNEERYYNLSRNYFTMNFTYQPVC